MNVVDLLTDEQRDALARVRSALKEAHAKAQAVAHPSAHISNLVKALGPAELVKTTPGSPTEVVFKIRGGRHHD
jgi:hypothetical protein